MEKIDKGIGEMPTIELEEVQKNYKMGEVTVEALRGSSLEM